MIDFPPTIQLIQTNSSMRLLTSLSSPKLLKTLILSPYLFRFCQHQVNTHNTENWAQKQVAVRFSRKNIYISLHLAFALCSKGDIFSAWFCMYSIDSRLLSVELQKQVMMKVSRFVTLDFNLLSATLLLKGGVARWRLKMLAESTNWATY